MYLQSQLQLQTGNDIGDKFNESFMQSRIDEGGGALALIARDWPYAKVLPSTFASFGMRKCCAQENIGGKSMVQINRKGAAVVLRHRMALAC